MKFENLDLHDSILAGIQIDFDKSAISMGISTYTTGDFEFLTISFENFYGLQLSGLSLDKNTELEVYEFSSQKLETGYIFNIIILLGIGRPSLNMKFHCESYHINKNTE